MFEVKVIVEIPGIPEAINRLADSLNGVRVPVSAPSAAAVPFQMPAAEASVAEATPLTAAETTAPAQSSTPAPTPVQPPVQSAAPAAPAVTLDAVTKAGAQLVDMGKMDELIALLQKFGVAAVTMLKPDQLPAIAADLRAMGASI